MADATVAANGRPQGLVAKAKDNRIPISRYTFNGSYTYPTQPGVYTVQAIADTYLYYGTATATLTIQRVGNSPPSCEIVAPLQNASYTAPASIALQVSALDSDGTVAKVEYYQGETKIGEVTSSPFTFQWTAVGVGNHTVTAKATDNQGASVTSYPVKIMVFPVGTNQSPTCSITSPSDGSIQQPPTTISVQVNAADSDGTIAKVEFFNGASKLGEDTTAPYEYVWNGVTAGKYILTAKATDDKGAWTLSKVITVTVSATVKIGDLDTNGVVNFDDLSLFLAAYGSITGETKYRADADLVKTGTSAGRVDFDDLSAFLAAYGK